MTILTAENLSKNYGERILLNSVNFSIEDGDKIGLIGVNGAGKSTFLKMVADLEVSDGGKLIKGSALKIEYLPQEPEFDDEATVILQVFKGNSPVMQLLREYEQVLEQSSKRPDDMECQKKLIELNRQMDIHDAWQLESSAKAILTKLGITDFSATIGNLSGGQKKRIALASALINPSDLLILDEPTNHIDNDTVAWLEDFIAKRKGALLMVTHDRYFLDRVATRIIELDQGQLYSYAGNYSTFVTMKAEREEQRAGSERKRQNLFRHELAWIRRGAQARSTKQKARIERFEELSAQKPRNSAGAVEISVGSSRLGRKILSLENISKGFDGIPFIHDFSYTLLRDDRVGIVGPNGSGKSTLLNLIAGRLACSAGMVEVGQTVKIGYFSQENAEMNQEMRVIDYIKEEAGYITTADGQSISAGQMLERFLFPSSVQWMPIAKLSGGEKRRLYLLRILMSSPNVLLLDEPTNDLDIPTLSVLENYLDDFPGAVVAVSHDRYFLDRLVDKIFAFEGDGLVTQYTGGYSSYIENRKLSEKEALPKSAKHEKNAAEKDPARSQPRKFSFKEQREYEQIEGLIADAEQELGKIDTAIYSAGSNFELLQSLVSSKQQWEHELDALLERWAYLTEVAEEMQKN
ncbi:MAG: ABC-F family ATP-binding cassette domain-containing protein [Negativicutes bacterium]